MDREELFNRVAKAIKILHNTKWLREHAHGDESYGAELLAEEYGFAGNAEDLLALGKILGADSRLVAFSKAVDEYYRSKALA